MHRIHRHLFILLVVPFLLAACARPTPETRVEVVKETVIVTRVVRETVEVTRRVDVTTTPLPAPSKVTLDLNFGADVTTLDPQTAEDPDSIDVIENLFVGLTRYNPETGRVEPALADSWDISDDGLTWTFRLRDDVTWVRYNPVDDAVEQIRPVVAADFLNGLRRLCHPTNTSYYAGVVAPFIKGCQSLRDKAPAEFREEDWDLLGVEAPEDNLLVIELEVPFSPFLSVLTMWPLRPIPQEVIDRFGERWIEPGVILTNGPFLLRQWVHGTRMTLERNPFWPADWPGNVEVVQIYFHDPVTAAAWWQEGRLDLLATDQVGTPDLVATPTAFFFAFAYDKEPFDNVGVRRAFSAALDREALVREALKGAGLPMRHLTPPGLFGAPPRDEVGVGFDPQLARKALEEAGYPDCQEFPQVTLAMLKDSPSWAAAVEFAIARWQEVLGCPADRFQVVSQDWDTLLTMVSPDAETEARPHLWTYGWEADYPDANNWLGDLLWCEVPVNQLKRPCEETDDLIVQARVERDPDQRLELYRQIEEQFFGPEGEFPIIPLWVGVQPVARQPWLTYSPAVFGGERYDLYRLDWKAKLAGP